MNREYHRWYSPSLGRDMELLLYGHAGLPVLVFPTSQGRFYEYEDRGMVGALYHQLERGSVQLFCVDSVDAESWYNRGAHPYWRVRRQEQYENYLLREVVPLVHQRNSAGQVAVTGCSFGGYHAVNFTLRHPDVVSHCVSMSGAFDIKRFMDGYYDDSVYFNNPPDYIPNIHDPWFLDRYREPNKFILAAGEWDICLGENYRLAQLMGNQGIPHLLDVWGEHMKHDWPWWHRMAQKYF